MSTTIEQLELEVSSNSTSAASGLDELSLSLRRLREAVAPVSKGGMGLGALSNSLAKFGQSVSSLSGLSIAKESIQGMVEALKPLENVQKSGFSSLANGLEKLGKVAPNIDSITESLRNADLDSFARECNRVADAITPLATQMEKVAAGFSAFPSKVQKLLSSNTKLKASNSGLTLSFANLAAKIAIAYTAMMRGARIIAGWLTKSTQYVENLNLFHASMGEYAEEAKEYANTVAAVMGIDPGEWMRNQGVFMTIATGFGIIGDRAAVISQNLTQLGYDIASFFNITVEEAMQKIKSGFSGELEPMRNIGYDLSMAKLQEEALALGIEKKVSAMTRAEKAELSYYTMMKQVSQVQGDMARTLDAPANQLRVLKAQVEQAARSLGNIFIPILNAVLPVAIAVTKVITMLASAIASLFGFALPSVDYSSIKVAAGGAGDLADNLGGAGDKAKKLKQALLGIDELNVISPPEDSGGGGSGIGGGGGFDFELPTYDFIGDAVSTRIDEIVQEMKEWLGLTEEISSWSDLFHTKLGRIVTTVGAVAAGLVAWKLSKELLDGLSALADLKKNGLDKATTIAIGATLVITGITLETAGIVDAIQNELNGMNWTQILGGGALLAGGGALIGNGLGSAILGGAIGGIVGGIPAFVTGVFDSFNNDINLLSASLTAVGATAAGAGIGAIIGSLGGPIGAGVGALIGLAVGLVTNGIILIVQKWDEITAWAKEFDEKVTDTFKGFAEKVSTTFNDVKTNVTTWAKETDEKLSEKFREIGGNIISAFNEHVVSHYLTTKSSITTWASGIKEWFAEHVSYDKFYTVASDVIEGFKDGIGKLYETCKENIGKWGKGIISWFKEKLDSNSPSKVFMRIGEDTVLGYNIGINSLSDTTKGVVNKWADSFTSVSPTMSFAVDTSALRYYNSDSFAKSVSANVTSNSSVTAVGFKEGMEEFYREYIEPTMAQMAADMRRQADKNEHPVVQIGNRVVSEAVTTQQRANGYVFAR